MRSLVLRLTCALCSIAAAGYGQNLVVNGTFDSNVNGWSSRSSEVTIAWNSADADGSPTSGSLLASNNAPGALDSGFVQCVDGLTGGAAYSFGAKMLIPAGGPAGQSFLQIDWITGAACTGTLISGDALGTTAQGAWVPVAFTDTAPAGTHSALVYGEVRKDSTTAGSYRTYYDDVSLEPAAGGTGACVPDATTLCIDDQPGDKRFKITGNWSAPGFGSGNAQAIQLASVGVNHGGILWFFSADNPEILIKVLNACTVNHKHWVFFAADTNVFFSVAVVDTTTGIERVYINHQGNPAGPLYDVNAFDCP